MPITATCRNCHKTFESRMFSFGPGVVINNLRLLGNTEICPYCGGTADMISGRFNYVEGVLKALAESGVTRAKVEAAKDIAAEASSGSISSDEAVAQLRQINATLATVVENSGKKGITWELILTLLMCIYTIWTDQKSDADAQAALKESRTQTEVARKMLEESRVQNEFLRELETRPISQPPRQSQTSAMKNRHERRKAAALERRTKRTDR